MSQKAFSGSDKTHHKTHWGEKHYKSKVCLMACSGSMDTKTKIPKNSFGREILLLQAMSQEIFSLR